MIMNEQEEEIEVPPHERLKTTGLRYLLTEVARNSDVYLGKYTGLFTG